MKRASESEGPASGASELTPGAAGAGLPEPRHAVDRRGFLSVGAAAAAGLGLGAGFPFVRSARAADAPASKRRAMSVIFMVSDGMSAGTLHLADLYIQRKHGRRSHWVGLIGRPDARRALMETSAADSIVTDSAAASTAWGIGERVNNEKIGLTPDGRMPAPLLVRAREQGKATGLVTTCRLSHATPAGFVANVPTNRDDEGPIAEQVLGRGTHVMLGGGGKFLTPELIARHQDLEVVRTRGELLGVKPRGERQGRRLLGVFASSHMAFELDRVHEEQPSLAEMSRAALAELEGAPGGFVLQIEGGRVDHAAHYNDAGSLIADQAAFDEALGVAMEFCARRGDTLLLVTSDHGNANPGLTDYGRAGNEGFERTLGVKRSFEWLVPRLKAPGVWARAGEIEWLVREACGVALGTDELATLQRWLGGELVDPYLMANRESGPVGSVLANHLAIAFLSPNHTSDPVELTVMGPGSELVPPFLSHADLHGIVVGAMDLGPAKAG